MTTKKDDDPPLITLLCLACLILLWIGGEANEESIIAEANKIEQPQLAVMMQETTLLPVIPVYIPETHALASIVRVHAGTYSLGTLTEKQTALMDKIIECESGGDPTICNKEYGCGAGMGLCQIIPSTLKYCEEKLGRELDPFNPKDNLECGIWLLENEGSHHWNQSKHCWDN